MSITLLLTIRSAEHAPHDANIAKYLFECTQLDGIFVTFIGDAYFLCHSIFLSTEFWHSPNTSANKNIRHRAAARCRLILLYSVVLILPLTNRDPRIS